MPKPPRIEQLSIYLLKPTIVKWQDAIRSSVSYDEIALPENAPPESVLIVRRTPPHPPNWLKFFPQATQQEIQDLVAASAGAALIVWAEGRWFAVCFGTGWHMLKKDSYERNFGLKVALSVIKRNTLKSVDVSTYDNFAKHRRVSTSKGTTIDSFDIEGQLDLLRGVVGDSAYPLGTQIGGKDPCIIWTRVPFFKIHRLCRILLWFYESDRAVRRYPIINNVAEVRDPSEISRLDGLLDAQLAANTHHDVSVAPPEVVDWQNVNTFKVDHQNAPAPSVSLEFSAIRTMLSPNMPTCNDMRKIEVGTQTPAGTAGIQSWTLYACLVTEVDDPQDANVKCILMAGDWYTVSKSFVTRVNQGLANIPLHVQSLPDALPAETEGDYNTRFSQTAPGNLTLLDKKNISYGGGSSRIEVCDVLSSASCLYHIKDYNGSATLSHLFAQGTVSARLLLEQEFRQELLNKYPSLPASVVQLNSITPAGIEITYAIICDPKRTLPIGLPFFSKVRLLESALELKRMGFTKVTVARIIRL